MITRSSGRIFRAALLVSALLTSAAIAQQTAYPAGRQPSPATAPAKGGSEPASPVSPTIQQIRREMLRPEASSLYFHNMDELFDTRKVGRSGAVWELPRRDAPVRISYAWQGASYGFPEFLDRTFTNALIVMKKGAIVSESYRNRTGPNTHFMSWSMAKSLTSALVGFALADRKIASLDDQLVRYLPELKGGGYDGVTVRQALQMRSGVDYEERYDFDNPGVAARNHENSLVRNVSRFADAAPTIKRAHPPGTHFAYKTLDTAVLGWLVERVTERPAAHYMAQKLWEPLGAEADGFFIMDGPPGIGREFTGAGYNAVARDYARFGQMILNNGTANGRQIMPPQWVAEATRPSTAEGPTGGYGYQWWTVPNSEAFYALGLQGQFIYIDPATQTVVVKLSYFPPEDQAVYGETLTAMQALSAWKPGD